VSLLYGVSKYYRAASIRGVIAMAAYRMSGHPRQIVVKHPAIKFPVHLRLGTTDASIYSALLSGGDYSIDLPFLPRVIIDVGANIGMASIYFANRYKEARIIAVEAEPENFRSLQKNVSPYSSIIPVHAALWSEDGRISIGLPNPALGQDGEWGFAVGEHGALVRSVTMRTRMREHSVTSIDLLKVDIEGAEKEVFEAADWTECVRCLMIENHDRFKQGCSAAVAAAMKRAPAVHRGETSIYCDNLVGRM